MGKLTTYIIIMSGLMILFYFAGLLPESTVSNSLLTMLLDPNALSESPIGLDSKELLAGIIAGGIIIGALMIANVELGIMAIFVVSLSAFMWDFSSVFNRVYAENPVIAILVFSPIMFLMIITLIEFWRGRD